jgi:hypothetical protein
MLKKIIIFSLLLAIIVCLFWFGYFWKVSKSRIAGVYTHAETWCLKITERDLIAALNKLKHEYKELEPPNVSYPTSGKADYGYDFIFYYADTDENVQVFVKRNSDPLYTTLGLVAITSHIDSLTPIDAIRSERHEINCDYNYFENKMQISKFENKVIKPLQEKILQANILCK